MNKIGEADDVAVLWGRSNSDVYATTARGLLHYDGKSWSPTSYTRWATVMGGTGTDVLLAAPSD